MSKPHNVILTISRGAGLSLRINDSYVSHTMEFDVLRELRETTAIPDARIDANIHCASDPLLGTPAAADVARWIATELENNEIYRPNIDLEVSRGAGLHLQINGQPVDNTYGTIVMAELAQLRDDFPAARVDATYRSASPPPPPAAMAELINIELDRNEIWD